MESMKSDYDFERVDKEKIDKALLTDTYVGKHNGNAKKSKADCDFVYADRKTTTAGNLSNIYVNRHGGKIKKGKEYDLVGQMPEKMQKRYFDAIKNK